MTELSDVTRVAAIDCGTNSIRLLVADVVRDQGGARLTDLTRQMRIVRLGRGVDRTGVLEGAAIERAVEATVEYQRMIEALGASRVRFVATSATRDAANSDEFTREIRRVIGVDPEVVPGTEEASLSFSGAVCGLGGSVDAPMLVVDIGGGSTELVLGVDEPSAAISLDTGSVRITERFLAAGVTPEAEAAARAEVRGLLDEAERVVDLSAPGRLVGLAGTITTVTAHALNLQAFDPQALNGAELSPQAVLASCEAIIHSTPEQRASWGYLAPGRRDVIAAGALVWSEVVTRVVERTAAAGRPLARVTTSLYDILDGIALSLVPEPGPAEGTPA